MCLYGDPSTTFRHGAVIAVLVSENRASRIACKLAECLASARPCDQVHLITGVVHPDRRFFAHDFLRQYAAETTANTTLTVVVKNDDQTLVESLVEHLGELQPHLVVLASETLCERQVKNTPAAATSFAMRLIKEIRHVPVLVVKGNSRGAFTQNMHAGAGHKTNGLKCMVDLMPNSRLMLEWLMELLGSRRDHSLALTVCQAVDQHHATKPLALRMMTTFGCQARVNGFPPARQFFSDPAAKCLPSAVEAQEVDVLVVQAPRSRSLSPAIVDLLVEARTNILIFPATDMIGVRPASAP